MSKIEYVQIHPQQLFILKDKIEFKESKELNAQMLPQIYNGATSWEEVNLYAYDLLINHQLNLKTCLLYTSPSPRDLSTSRMPSSA